MTTLSAVSNRMRKKATRKPIILIMGSDEHWYTTIIIIVHVRDTYPHMSKV